MRARLPLLNRTALYVTVPALLATAAWFAGRQTWERARDNYRIWEEAQATAAQDAERAASLAAKLRHVRERIQAKDRIGRDLVAGRLTVGEAGQALGRLPCSLLLWQRLHEVEEGDSEHERLCRHMIGHVCAMCAEHPGYARLLHRRLMDQLREELRKPPPPPSGPNVTWGERS
jgi:hypothetical protein